MTVLNIAAYRYISLEHLPDLKASLQATCLTLGVKGTILLSPEGYNLMLAADIEKIQQLQDFLAQDSLFSGLTYKESLSAHIPFKKMLVKIKKQIIPFAEGYFALPSTDKSRLAPRQLKRWLDEGKPLLLLDARNDYEIEKGTFKNAKTLKLRHFRHFPMICSAELNPSDLPVVTFCTGGVRCEKVVPFLQAQGYAEVYQLEGGILQYFKDCGKAHYIGECFVFDERVINKDLL